MPSPPGVKGADSQTEAPPLPVASPIIGVGIFSAISLQTTILSYQEDVLRRVVDLAAPTKPSTKPSKPTAIASSSGSRTARTNSSLPEAGVQSASLADRNGRTSTRRHTSPVV